MMILNGVKKVTIVDWSEYDPNLCCNGGKYMYETTYHRRSSGEWDVLYSTSADFEFCPYCGMFGDGCGCTHPEQSTTAEVMKQISSAKDDPDFTVEMIMDDGSEVEL